MKVLIVERDADLSRLWRDHVVKLGGAVLLVATENAACAALLDDTFDVIILDLVLEEGSALSVADFASLKQPDARVIFVSSNDMFSDGSIFRFCPNACAFVQSAAPPSDIAALVEHHARTAPDALAPVAPMR